MADELGLPGMAIPEEYGGIGAGLEAARRRWLPAIAAGELIAAVALPGTLAGGDGTGLPAWEAAARPAGAQRAEAPDGWRLDGTAGSCWTAISLT